MLQNVITQARWQCKLGQLNVSFNDACQSVM
jgi:hypothetical protein